MSFTSFSSPNGTRNNFMQSDRSEVELYRLKGRNFSQQLMAKRQSHRGQNLTASELELVDSALAAEQGNRRKRFWFWFSYWTVAVATFFGGIAMLATAGDFNEGVEVWRFSGIIAFVAFALVFAGYMTYQMLSNRHIHTADAVDAMYKGRESTMLSGQAIIYDIAITSFLTHRTSSANHGASITLPRPEWQTRFRLRVFVLDTKRLLNLFINVPEVENFTHTFGQKINIRYNQRRKATVAILDN
ncbi:MAG: hypothetical protein FWC00_04890 [Firmicutes bacterium]|nr:hypothetical protein [Bacillota bacterium]